MAPEQGSVQTQELEYVELPHELPHALPLVSPTVNSNWTQLDEAVLAQGEVCVPEDDCNVKFSWRTLWAYTGPGWLMSIGYLDPGNLEGDLQAGAYAGYQLIWVLWVATLLGLFLQILSARLGVVTGMNLAQVSRRMYPRWVSRILWLMTEVAIIGADIQEVLGSAIALQILFALPLWAGCVITVADTFIFMGLQAYGIRKLEAFFATLIGIMLVCFCINYAHGNVDQRGAIEGAFIPRVNSYAVTQAVGILGSIIMPHNIYLHSGLVQSRQVDRTSIRQIKEATKYFSIEAAGALFVSVLINVFVLGVFAKGFFSSDCVGSYAAAGVNSACMPLATPVADPQSYGACTLADGVVGTCVQIGLSDASAALSGMLGGSAHIIWAIGLLAAGQSATITTTFAGQYVMEGFLQIRWAPWKRTLVTRCVSLAPALAVALRGDSDTLEEILNLVQSIQLPFALLPLVHFTCSETLMGTAFVNSRWTRVLGWLTALVICAVNIYLIIQTVISDSLSMGAIVGVAIAMLLYFSFLLYLVHDHLVALLTFIRMAMTCNRA